MNKMQSQNPFRINEGARRMIYFGVPAIPISVLICEGPHLEHFVSEKVLPYVFFGALAAISILGMFAYNVTPKRFVLPLGIAGWLVSALLICWWAWFGPGAFGRTPLEW